jgi:hypothetical protein
VNLKKLPEVSIDPRENYLFIVAEVCDNKGGKKLVLRAKSFRSCEYHSELREALCEETRGLRVAVVGGGLLFGSPQAGSMTISSDSNEFGKEPNRELTAQMLRSAFPEAKVTIKN